MKLTHTVCVLVVQTVGIWEFLSRRVGGDHPEPQEGLPAVYRQEQRCSAEAGEGAAVFSENSLEHSSHPSGQCAPLQGRVTSPYVTVLFSRVLQFLDSSIRWSYHANGTCLFLCPPGKFLYEYMV